MLIANPNCTTAIAAMALWPLHCKYNIKKLIVSTYQAASGAGMEVGQLCMPLFTFEDDAYMQGMEELRQETKKVMDGQPAGNVLIWSSLKLLLLKGIKFSAVHYHLM